jgi:hypothetical protein
MPPQSGFVGQGGLVTGGPPPDFYLRAGGIPGYQNLVQQTQVGQQAWDRQKDDQYWRSNTMTLAEKTNQDRLLANDKWERDYKMLSFNPQAGMTNYEYMTGQNQAGMLGVARQNAGTNAGQLGIARQEFEAKYPVNPVTGQREPRPEYAKPPANYQYGPDGVLTPIPGSAPYVTARSELDPQVSLLNNIDQYIGLANQGGSQLWAGETARKAEAMRKLIVQDVARANNPGKAPTDADIEAADKLVPDLVGTSNVTKAKVGLTALRDSTLGRYRQSQSRYPSITEGAYSGPVTGKNKDMVEWKPGGGR